MTRTALLVVLLAMAPPVLADSIDDVRCSEIGFSRAAERRDPEAFASYIDEDARFVGRTVTRGPAAITEGWNSFFIDDGLSIKWRPQFVEVLEDGTLALTRGPYRMTAIDEAGTATEYWGTFNSVWRLQPDGEWKVVFDAGNSASEPPPEETQQLLEQDDDCPRD